MKDNCIVITGASRGLGKALAELFLKEGAQVFISDKDIRELETTAHKLHTPFFAADVTNEEELEALKQKAVEEFGHIDMWINNAGVWLPRSDVEDIDMVRAHQLVEVNLFGTMHGSRVAVREMKKQGKGTIVNIISTSALQGRPLSSAYAASKWAARGFTLSLREELAESPIHVLAVYPGGMKTALFDEKRPNDFDAYMTPEYAAGKIIENLNSELPDPDLVIKRPGQIIHTV